MIFLSIPTPMLHSTLSAAEPPFWLPGLLLLDISASLLQLGCKPELSGFRAEGLNRVLG